MATRFIGDVHGKYTSYIKLASEASHSIQLGDLGFNYDCLSKLDPARHKVLGGNHDNYTTDEWNCFKYMQTGHWLGDYGVYTLDNGNPVYFIRGGYSIDLNYRIVGINYWPEEELSYNELELAISDYASKTPSFVISHEAPDKLIDAVWPNSYFDGKLLTGSRTAKALTTMWQIHQPNTWIFGHHHKSLDVTVNNTRFICLPELGYIDID